ncbi:MAG: hypothetical protein M0Z91_04545 [Actinomycetota bacterium]|nr:hypothetical protein [Actinomycetota bacterium]
MDEGAHHVWTDQRIATRDFPNRACEQARRRFGTQPTPQALAYIALQLNALTGFEFLTGFVEPKGIAQSQERKFYRKILISLKFPVSIESLSVTYSDEKRMQVIVNWLAAKLTGLAQPEESSAYDRCSPKNASFSGGSPNRNLPHCL